MPTLRLIRRGTRAPDRDLWPRLRARLGDQEHVQLRLPAMGWLEVAALAVAIGTLASVPDPLRLLVSSGLL
jgi:hypothetical protein